MCFRNLEGKPERKSPKKTISANGGPGLLQIVSEAGTKRCASEEVEPQKGVNTRRCVGKDIEPRGWIGESHIDRRREQVPTRTLALKGGGL